MNVFLPYYDFQTSRYCQRTLYRACSARRIDTPHGHTRFAPMSLALRASKRHSSVASTFLRPTRRHPARRDELANGRATTFALAAIGRAYCLNARRALLGMCKTTYQIRYDSPPLAKARFLLCFNVSKHLPSIGIVGYTAWCSLRWRTPQHRRNRRHVQRRGAAEYHVCKCGSAH